MIGLVSTSCIFPKSTKHFGYVAVQQLKKRILNYKKNVRKCNLNSLMSKKLSATKRKSAFCCVYACKIIHYRNVKISLGYVLSCLIT